MRAVSVVMSFDWFFRFGHTLKAFFSQSLLITCSKRSGGGATSRSRDGTVIWTGPTGETYTTHPGRPLMFPALCTLTAPVTANRTEAPVNQPAAR